MGVVQELMDRTAVPARLPAEMRYRVQPDRDRTLRDRVLKALHVSELAGFNRVQTANCIVRWITDERHR
jgi:hypothetical protein